MNSSFENLINLFISDWYVDKDKADVHAANILTLLKEGGGLEYLKQHYDITFSNLNFANPLPRPYKKKIAVLCFKHYVDFRPHEVINGQKFSGSEEALIYMSELLAKDGNRVVVYANITSGSYESLKPNNPRYLQTEYFTDMSKDNEGRYDIVICWRMYEFPIAKFRGDRVYLWIQDLPPNNISSLFLDGMMCLSDYQRLLFENNMTKMVPYVIAGNGLVLDYYSEDLRKNITRKPHSCFYGSNYGKGLRVLLEIWDKILEEFPDATLDICFGRTNWCTITDEELNYIISLIEKYPSIAEHGRLSNSEVAKKMMECSILSYPITHKSATFEITVVQAQCAGCIPAVIWNYCIPEVAHKDSFHCYYPDEYLETLLSALRSEDKIDRQKFIDWGSQFTWERVMNKWYELFS